MDTKGFVAGPLSVLCSIALVVGTASAAAIPVTDGAPGGDPVPVHQEPSLNSLILSLEEKEVNDTELTTALQNGDTESMKKWLLTYLQAHSAERPEGAGLSAPDLTGATRQERIIARTGVRKVDITDRETDLLSGDTTAVKAWLETSLPSHEG
jgi:hypothetical protein